MSKLISYRRSRAGISLVEVMICMLILLIVGLAAIASIIYTRQSMELDKQRLAALNYCRQAMEIASAHATVSSGQSVLVPFNTPGAENLFSELRVDYFPIMDTSPNVGKIDWSKPLVVASQDVPVVCRVQVTWSPLGAFYKMASQKVSMYTVIRAGTI